MFTNLQPAVLDTAPDRERRLAVQGPCRELARSSANPATGRVSDRVGDYLPPVADERSAHTDSTYGR